ncbi:hypothetical protein AB5J52_49515 (plasmid) [Streptomyces sp. R39]|uniref:ATP-grasp domain-containing protein n=1 Tax=Streptomyces sp. R39 TaxID=3238631 RepID=A0AB39RAY0_9ACTN
MAVIFISNLPSLAAEMGDRMHLSPGALEASEIFAQQVLWGASPGDIVILPTRPSREFLHYVTDLLEFKAESLTISALHYGGGDARSNSPSASYADFLEDMRIRIKETGVDQGCPSYFDIATADLLQALGLHRTTPGFNFCSQGGTTLLNSKVNFRAIALGAGLPVPEGSVADTPERLSSDVWRQLNAGRQAIVKQEFNTGGFGNLILSSRKTGSSLGAARKAVLSTREQVVNYISDHWMQYSNGGRSRVIIERYMENSSPVYAEFAIKEGGTHLLHCGEIRMNPVYSGVEVPIKRHHGKNIPEFLKGSEKIAKAAFTLGYRGYMSVDAIFSADGHLLFNEVNARSGGATHIHHIGERIIGSDYMNRCLLVGNGLAEADFPDLSLHLYNYGLSYDRRRRAGVILTSDITRGGLFEYCVTADSSEECRDIEYRFLGILKGVPKVDKKPQR